MQLCQVEWDECNWSTRYLLCQDVILLPKVGSNDNIREMQTSDYANWPKRQGRHVSTVTPKDPYQNVKIRQDDKLWISGPENYGDGFRNKILMIIS